MADHYSVLLIETNTQFLSGLEKTLKKLPQVSFFTAANGEQATAVLNASPIDMILINMNDYTANKKKEEGEGACFLEKHKKSHSLEIIGYGDRRLRNKTLAAGAVGYLEKPFDPEDFAATVKQYLAPQEGFNGIGVDGMNLCDLFQVIELNKRSVLIKIHNNHSDTGKVYFDEGITVHATTKEKTGKEAFYEIISWEGGNIKSLQLPAEFPATISCPTSLLLMETMSVLDEREYNCSSLQEPDYHKETAVCAPLTDLQSESINTGTLVPSQSTITKEKLMDLQKIQEKFKSEIQGFVSAVVVEAEQSLLIAGTSVDPSFDTSVPVGFFNEVFRSANNAFHAAEWGVPDNILISGTQSNVVIFNLKNGAYWQGICITKETPVGMALAQFRAMKKDIEAELP